MNGFNIYVENPNFRKDVMDNSGISYEALYDEQRVERPKYNPEEVCDLVSDSFKSVNRAAILLSANGLFLKYAGPTIRSNFMLVKIAVNQNGDAIRYVDLGLLMSDPQIVAELILSATIGHPCEAFRDVVNDRDYIIEVSKKIVELDPNMLHWVGTHMFGRDGYDVSQRMIQELSSSRRR